MTDQSGTRTEDQWPIRDQDRGPVTNQKPALGIREISSHARLTGGLQLSQGGRQSSLSSIFPTVINIREYWSLIGQYLSRELNTGLWLVINIRESDQLHRARPNLSEDVSHKKGVKSDQKWKFPSFKVWYNIVHKSTSSLIIMCQNQQINTSGPLLCCLSGLLPLFAGAFDEPRGAFDDFLPLVQLWSQDRQGQDDHQEARSWSTGNHGSSDYRWERCLWV